MNDHMGDHGRAGSTHAARSRVASRRPALVGAAVVLLALAVWVVVANRRDSGDPPADAMTAMDHSAADANDMAGMDHSGAGADAMADMPGMDMSTDGSVRLTANQIRQFGVTFGTADVRTLEDKIRTTGIVNFDETRIVQVSPKFGGFAERLHVDFTGQPVRRGQPLLEIYSPELVAAQEEMLIARRLERAMNETVIPGVPAGSSNLLAAATRRLRLWDITEAQIEQILRTGEVQRSLVLVAPASGVVLEKNVVRGQAVQSGQSLYTIADLTRVWVEVELREHEAGRVREGSVATLEFGAFPGRSVTGHVDYVYPTLQEASRTIKARIALENPDGRIKPGMFATVLFSSSGASALGVPAAAVVRTGERSMVFVDMGGGRLMPHEIVTGRVGDAFVEVLSGVEPGQRVVTSAQFLLESESNLGEVMRAMMGMGGDMGDMQGMDMKGMDMPSPGKRP